MMKKFLAALAITASAISANATTVDFTGMPDFANYSQNGMSMTANSVWNWPGSNMAHMDSGVATFQLINGGDFNLDSVFMVSNGGSGPARFTAFNNGINLGSVDLAGNIGTFMFGSMFDGIDQFQVSVIGSHFTFDDVNFTEVPEPASLALLGLGIAGLALRRRNKNA